MKVCTRCKKEKPEEDFAYHKGGKENLRTQCKICHSIIKKEWCRKNPKKIKLYSERKREKRRKNTILYDNYCKREVQRGIERRYGLTPENYLKILTRQGGICAICGNTCKSRNRLSVDHDHITGRVRGLLCIRCNSVLGFVNDNEELLTKMSSYLRLNRMGAQGA